LNNHYEHFLRVAKSAAQYASEFDNKTNPYREGIDDHKAWAIGLNFCGPLEQWDND